MVPTPLIGLGHLRGLGRQRLRRAVRMTGGEVIRDGMAKIDSRQHARLLVVRCHRGQNPVKLHGAL